MFENTPSAKGRLLLVALLFLLVVALLALVRGLIVFKKFTFACACAAIGMAFAGVESSNRIFIRKSFLGPGASLLVIVLLLGSVLSSAEYDYTHRWKPSADTRILEDLRLTDTTAQYAVRTVNQPPSATGNSLPGK